MPIRLIHSRAFTFHVFPTKREPSIPKYAILSHTWGDDEVTHQQFLAIVQGGQIQTAGRGPGLDKIINCCRQAVADGLNYVWVDTCCIDKTNHAELTEAINSMFLWYKRSTVCYAYLSDVPANDNPSRDGSAFRNSLWFTRGWTLQELLAPKNVVFYSGDWMCLDTKLKLRRTISEVTGIDEGILMNKPFDKASVSMKMSWAGNRQTFIIEDQAYCLLGLFDVSLPMIYGERERAFQRLQLELYKSTADHTIFAWTGDGLPSGMLAQSPAQFLLCEDASRALGNRRCPLFYMTNRGLETQLPLAATPLRNVYVAVLNCVPLSSRSKPPVFLALLLYRRFDKEPDFVRVYSDEVVCYPSALEKTKPVNLVKTDVYVDEVGREPFHMNRWTTFHVKGYPSRGTEPRLATPSGQDIGDRFSCADPTLGLPPLVAIQLDDRMASTVFLFKNAAGHRFAVCITLWGDDIKFGISADIQHDDMRRVADGFLFGKREQVLKKPGDHTLRTSLAKGKKASVTLGSVGYDASTGSFVCDVNITATDGFWFDMAGPGMWPGWWERYTDWLSAKAGKSRRSLLGRRS